MLKRMLKGQDNAYPVGRASIWGVSNQHWCGKGHCSHGDQLCTDFTGKDNIKEKAFHQRARGIERGRYTSVMTG